MEEKKEEKKEETKFYALNAIAKELNDLADQANNELAWHEQKIKASGAGVEVWDDIPFCEETTAEWYLGVDQHGNLRVRPRGNVVSTVERSISEVNRKLRIFAARRIPNLMELIFKRLLEERDLVSTVKIKQGN